MVSAAAEPPLAAFGQSPEAIAVVIVVVGVLLAAELLLFARGREPTLRESVAWSAGWRSSSASA